MIDRKIATAISATSLGIVLSGTAVFADAKTGTVTASALNIRSGPSTNDSVVGYAYKGDKLQILETSNGWYKVKLSNGKTGWGSGKYINVSGDSSSETPSSGKTGTITADALNVRSGPSTSYGKVTMVYKGQSVTILESSNGWHKIKTQNGQIGWASGDYISTSGQGGGGSEETPSTGKGTVTADALNIRSGPSTSNSIVGKAYKGNTVDILSSSNGWYKVKLSNGQVGWASGDYISTSGQGGGGSEETPSTGKGTVTASALNIRSGPSTSNSIVGKAYKGNTVDILSSSNGWYKVKLSNGQVGWGSSDYISRGGEGSGGSEGSGGGSSETNKAQAIINTTKAQLGKPYVWGAEGPNSFDCSGLVYYVYGQHGIKMPRTSREQANVGTTVSQSQLQPGDLIFSSTDGSGGVNHVGIYIGNGQMIHAPNSNDVVKTTNINTSYWQNAYVKAKRVL
ncbi:SH3 domain-containing protein [Paraclostridium bifermentans]|uniref:SH3 domain-containing protein n=1 Tax=Paraclostridium bifermentans TaxID=1490 RepID=A0ABY8QZ45_PARBF|nr:SH3 domain-containing protein [Paraclostridium bifermentans]